MELWTALSIGLLGSLHCVGMCGPIAFALPLDRSNQLKAVNGGFLYNLGRLLSYFSLGLLFGFVGYGFALAGFQRWISISVGAIMILSVVLGQLSESSRFHLPAYNLWIGRLKAELGKRFGKKSLTNLFSIGILNGYLPCGLVYMALAGATAAGGVLEGGVFMLFFGLGTIPLMLAVAVFGNQLKVSLFKQGRKFIPVFIVLIGSLFILRGMNLGVPFISPKLDHKEVVECN
ncbi:MAG: sulfite exporter TauE/SafE family protein [Vicingaceae bacterium]